MLPIYFAVMDEDCDRELFDMVYQQFYNRMMRVARQILPSQTQAEDAVHDAFLKIIQHFDDLKAVPEERRIYWVVTVTKNAAVDLLRKERRDLPMDEEVQRQAPAVPAEEGGFRALVEIIRQMPDTYRRVLELRFLTEWSHAEIARELHISEGAVKTRVARGRQMLIESMRKEGYVCE